MLKTVDHRLKDVYNTYTMKQNSFTIKLKRPKRRAVELYSPNSPFKGKVEESRVAYKRHAKNQKELDKDLGQ